jgi:hypothetical protein
MTHHPCAEVLGDSEGWHPSTPPGMTEAEIADDRAICKNATCSECGSRGLEYRPLTRRTNEDVWDGSRKRWAYRVLGICSKCGVREEF